MIMKSVSKSIGLVVLGVAIGSLPYSLSLGRVSAQQDLSRLKPKHVPVQPDHVAAENGNVYVFYQGHVLHLFGSELPPNQWKQLPDVPVD